MIKSLIASAVMLSSILSPSAHAQEPGGILATLTGEEAINEYRQYIQTDTLLVAFATSLAAHDLCNTEATFWLDKASGGIDALSTTHGRRIFLVSAKMVEPVYSNPEYIGDFCFRAKAFIEGASKLAEIKLRG